MASEEDCLPEKSTPEMLVGPNQNKKQRKYWCYMMCGLGWQETGPWLTSLACTENKLNPTPTLLVLVFKVLLAKLCLLGVGKQVIPTTDTFTLAKSSV